MLYCFAHLQRFHQLEMPKHVDCSRCCDIVEHNTTLNDAAKKIQRIHTLNLRLHYTGGAYVLECRARNDLPGGFSHAEFQMRVDVVRRRRFNAAAAAAAVQGNYTLGDLCAIVTGWLVHQQSAAEVHVVCVRFVYARGCTTLTLCSTEPLSRSHTCNSWNAVAD